MNMTITSLNLADLQNRVEEIANHLECLYGVRSVHAPGTYESTLNSKASSTWGWTEPLQFKGQAIVWHRFSPDVQGGHACLAFDFKSIS